MPIITLPEIVDIIVMTVAIGYIFSKFFKRAPQEGYDPLTYYRKNPILEDIKYGAMIAAPAVVFHELAHKFTAMGFGASATLYAPSFFGIPYGMYLLVIILIHLNFPILFFVGGYVSHTALSPLASSMVAFSGPLLNLILWLIGMYLIKHSLVNRKYYPTIGVMAKLNMYFFIFNMIPLPGFDGFSVFAGLLQTFF
ncbi:MAG: M50 family metallopeptidase [Candidatus Woesearchaeota archaeon]|jgi:Zn-dependent protease|nr:M50 family metallopeptidase [Candidatus Woesearchaeota archaeon]MDP6265315.1 M50 family metallopeptidase [Candidatus Woesearchaeota archaeon]MDP7322687.1 M50 family metallopeptidase [Candidatus Woesearchaeota archaeon]MDP7476007.1 M50 family metallopeptidase [Candidatus Woesearchaeota archaeon]HJO01842.1 M50 family metallopeptidase [Candidatus Woesearchaeota archaeon]|tara:strand:- start:2378 stop:2965 length:588 start_codon:yes stop_codon:yes gene_type:complete